MRILLVAPEPFLEVRGTPINVLNMCRALAGAGHEVHLATFPMGEDVRMDGLTIHRCPRVPGLRRVPIGFSWTKALLDVLLAARVALLLATSRFHVVHAVEESVFFCLPLARLARLPMIYDLDSIISEQLRYEHVITSEFLLGIVRRLERRAVRKADCVLTVCSALSDYVSSVAPGARIFQIEDAPLDSAVREPDPSEVQRLRRELGLEGRLVVMYTGNIAKYQGLDLLLGSIGPVVKARPDVRFVLVGVEESGGRELRARAAESGVDGHLVMCGRQPPERMPEFMGMADLLVSPRSEGTNTPMKIFTYMRSGRPIVATDLPTHTQVLDPSVAFLAPASREGLAATILRALSDPQGAAAMARTAREKAEREFSYEVFSGKLLEMYRFIERRAAAGSPS